MNKRHAIAITFVWLSTTLIAPASNSSQDVYKCVDGDKIIYQGEPCPEEDSDKSANSFGDFDGWQFGQSIASMKQTAKYRRLIINPGKTLFAAQFNENLLNSQPDQRQYSYRTDILGKPAIVILFFTQSSQKLYAAKVTFSVVSSTAEERAYFYESLFGVLVDKYGDPRNIERQTHKTNNPISNVLSQHFTNQLLGTRFEWDGVNGLVVTLDYKKNYQHALVYVLEYQSVPLANQNKIETTAEIRSSTDRKVKQDSSRL